MARPKAWPTARRTRGKAHGDDGRILRPELCALNLTPAFFSADVFGLTVSVVPSNDMGIGRRLEDIVPSCMDYVSPMLYPSTFIPGNLGLDSATGTTPTR